MSNGCGVCTQRLCTLQYKLTLVIWYEHFGQGAQAGEEQVNGTLVQISGA